MTETTTQENDTEQKGNKFTTYTDIGKLYDTSNGVFDVTLAGRSVSFSIATIFDDMIGKTPEKGKSMYDYENRTTMFVAAFKIGAFVRQCRNVINGTVVEARSSSIRDEVESSISFFAPGALDGVDSYSILIVKGETEAIYIFPKDDEIIEGYDINGVPVVDAGNTSISSDELEWFSNLLDALLRVPYGLEIHGGRSGAKEFAGGTASYASKNAGRTSTNTRFSRTSSAAGSKSKASSSKVSDVDLDDDDIPL
jgi:hypothetical protein